MFLFEGRRWSPDISISMPCMLCEILKDPSWKVVGIIYKGFKYDLLGLSEQYNVDYNHKSNGMS